MKQKEYVMRKKKKNAMEIEVTFSTSLKVVL